jgi:hypothetical protein
MKLLKLSQLRKHTNSNGVTSILVDKDTILKISFPELLLACDQSVRVISEEVRVRILGDVIERILFHMSVPMSIVDNIRKSFEIPLEVPEPEELSPKEEELLGFVSLLVNEESPSNMIEGEEFSQVIPGIEIQEVMEILTQKGYSVNEEGSGLLIKLSS